MGHGNDMPDHDLKGGKEEIRLGELLQGIVAVDVQLERLPDGSFAHGQQSGFKFSVLLAGGADDASEFLTADDSPQACSALADHAGVGIGEDRSGIGGRKHVHRRIDEDFPLLA